jgi:tail tube GTA-gp10-like protein
LSEADPCARSIEWAGATHSLNLNHPWVRRVLSIRGIPGPNGSSLAACLSRFEAGNYSTDDVERVLELGLIGGGMSERDADKLLDAHVRGKPIATNAGAAASALIGLFMGNAS